MADAGAVPHRVLVLVNEAFDTAGGNLRAAVNVAEAMAEIGDDVTLTAPWVASHSHATVDGLDPRVTCKLFPASRLLARFGGSARQLVWMARTIRSFDQVQVHSLFHLSAVYAIVLCLLRRVPVFLWPHGTLDPFDLRKHAVVKRWIGPVITQRLLQRCAAVVFTTERESRVAVTYGAQIRHSVVPLPVRPLPPTTVDRATFRARFSIPADAPVVLFLGRVNYKKGLPLLVEAIARTARDDLHLVVAGSGDADQLRQLEAAARRHGIVDRVRTTGWLDGDLRTAAYCSADVFALLSDSENFGLAVVEALCTGLPALISDQVFIAGELAGAGAARVVPRDAAAAAAALVDMLADAAAARAMADRGRDYVRQHYEPRAVAVQLHDLVDRLGPGRLVRDRTDTEGCPA